MAAELDAVGLLATLQRPQPRCMEHADLARLTYLQAVIKVGRSFLSCTTRCMATRKVGQYKTSY